MAEQVDLIQVELSSLLDAARDTETKMVEMSALNHLMSTHVLQQAQQIEYLYDEVEGCGCRSINIDFPVDFEASIDDIIIQDKDIVMQQLRGQANEDQYCGGSSIVDRKVILDSRKTIFTYVVATNIAQYNGLPSKTFDISGFYDKKVNGEREKVDLDSGIDISADSVLLKKVRVH